MFAEVFFGRPHHMLSFAFSSWMVSIAWSCSSYVPPSNTTVFDEPAEALARLPDHLGEDRYASLRAQGAMMTAE